MHDEANFHPEFLAKWPENVTWWVRLLADPELQRKAWIERSIEEVDFEDFWFTIGELVFPEDFVRIHADRLHPSFVHAFLDATRLVYEFGHAMSRNMMYEPSAWIETEQWAACVDAGRSALAMIESGDWMTDEPNDLSN